jgi:hypothetical protein
LKSEPGAIRIDPWRLIATSDRCKIKWSNSSDKTSCHLLPSDLSESRNKQIIHKTYQETIFYLNLKNAFNKFLKLFYLH